MVLSWEKPIPRALAPRGELSLAPPFMGVELAVKRRHPRPDTPMNGVSDLGQALQSVA